MKWGDAEKENWFKQQSVQRSYLEDIVTQIKTLSSTFDIHPYGTLPVDPARYPLYLLKSKTFSPAKKTVLITGGVHGYETSGPHGALGFLKQVRERDLEEFNIACAPCISPWGYETVNRWNPSAIDPNRSFYPDSPSDECRLFLQAMDQFQIDPYLHIDLHETTDTDNTVFRPAKAARDGVPAEDSEIPDGFYLVGDSENPAPGFQKAIIEAVRKVTHIAPADRGGRLIGESLAQEGVVNYPVKKLFLCAGFSNARLTTTTEVYPDSPKATPALCIQAQIAAVNAALAYLRG